MMLQESQSLKPSRSRIWGCSVTIQAKISKSRSALRSDTLLVPSILDNGHSTYKVQRAHPFFYSPEVWKDLRVHPLGFSSHPTPDSYANCVPYGAEIWLADGTATPEATVERQVGSSGLLLRSLCSEPLRRGSATLPHRLDNRGNLFWQIISPETCFENRYVPVI